MAAVYSANAGCAITAARAAQTCPRAGVGRYDIFEPKVALEAQRGGEKAGQQSSRRSMQFDTASHIESRPE
jgi:hypothetical protein